MLLRKHHICFLLDFSLRSGRLARLLSPWGFVDHCGRQLLLNFQHCLDIVLIEMRSCWQAAELWISSCLGGAHWSQGLQSSSFLLETSWHLLHVCQRFDIFSLLSFIFSSLQMVKVDLPFVFLIF
jgi:hypothetical protein